MIQKICNHYLCYMSSKLSYAEKTVLSVLREQRKGSMNAVRVWSRLPANSGLDKDSVYKSLLKLVQKNLALQVSKGNFMYLQPPSTLQGRIRFGSKGDAYVVAGEGEQAIEYFVPEEFVSNALPGDLVEIITVSSRKKTIAKISSVVERSSTPIVGVLDVFEGNAWLLPDKKNFPFDIRIEEKIDPKLDHHKASVIVKDFPSNGRNPIGTISEILGKTGSNDAEMHSIVAEFGFRVSFPESVEKETQPFPDTLQAGKQYPDRKDFRNILTFTIDPADAKDFDDALSFEVLDNGNYSIGVHIADVSHYVTRGSALDDEALKRGTSVYLADRTIPMLPEKLSNNLCSLRPNEDRFAFSAVMEITELGEVQRRWFGKTVIHSDRRFSYEEAQEVLEQGTGDHAKELITLNRIAKQLNKARMRAGAMSFESEEIRFELDSLGKPTKILLKKRKDAHRLIEEYMLLANREVAWFIKEENKPTPPFIYRTHDNPNQERLIELARFCHLFGYKLDINSIERLRSSLNAILEAIQGKPEEDVISQMAIRSMARAIYTGQRSDHFGLAFSHYCHFTSPIRRYPDLLAHRILEAVLQKKQVGYSDTDIEIIAKQNSASEQKATEAERASTKYKMAEYLQQHIGQTFEAVISGVTEWGLFAEIIENHCEGLLRLADIRGDRWVFFEKEKKVKGQRTRREFKIGDIIQIRVKNANPQLRMIDFSLV